MSTQRTAEIITPENAPKGFPFATSPWGAASGYFNTATAAWADAALNGWTATVPVPEGMTELPLHQPHLVDGKIICRGCGQTVEADTYSEYAAWWEANEYEGERGHEPMTAEMYAYLEATCNGPAA